MSAQARPRCATVLTHQRPQDTMHALGQLREAAARAGVTLRFDATETQKHGLQAGEGILLDAHLSTDVDLCVVLGGDGTILRGLRSYIGSEVPVYAVNFGQIGFLATIDPDECDPGFERAFAGDFEVMRLPVISMDGPKPSAAINDISLHRRSDGRVAHLAYAVGGEEVGRVRCDGLVVATAAGSTGYNLANGGPVMAWGVEGYVVSFISPHSLTARALVVAPDDSLTLRNVSRGEWVQISVDGRPAGSLAAGEAIELRFMDGEALLAQTPGASFYHRLRQKFGRLAA
jgi:NAD+ kinase